MKKGRHRRYEEARKFQRDSAAQFTVEDFDFDAPDPFDLSHDDEDVDVEEDEDDRYADLAAKYADFDPRSKDSE